MRDRGDYDQVTFFKRRTVDAAARPSGSTSGWPSRTTPRTTPCSRARACPASTSTPGTTTEPQGADSDGPCAGEADTGPMAAGGMTQSLVTVQAMATSISLKSVEATPTAVVRATTSWAEFPSLWGPMLDKVWAFLRQAPPGLHRDGHNIMLYEDDVVRVEVGVQVTGPFEPAGDVVPSWLPGGLVAMTTHVGPIDKIGDTHQAVVRWCAENGHIADGRPWEIYGDPDQATGHFDVEVYWSVSPG